MKESELLDLLLEARASSSVTWDPLLPLYVDGLCKVGRVKSSSALASLLKHSSILDGSRSDEGEDEGQVSPFKSKMQKPSTLMTDIKVIQDVMVFISTGSIPKTVIEAADIYSATVDWILAVVAWHNHSMDPSQPTGGLMGSPDAVSLFESLGILLAALSGTSKGLEFLSSDFNQGLKTKLGEALSSYLPLCIDVSLPLRHRLEELQKVFNLYPGQPSKALHGPAIDGVNVNALQFESSVMDGPVVNTRAGLYVYINSMVVGRPLVDDTILINYLTNRYQGLNDVLIEEIITAAFDVLSNGVYRNESGRTMLLFRSFLVNKLPAFFAAISAASMVPISMEICISHALSRLDPNAFPSFSQMFSMQGSSVLSDARQEFLFACASHKLIRESSIEQLLGENPMQTLPGGGPYVKDDLISQINNNHERAEQLIGEIESMEGNAGAIVGAVVDVIQNLCHQKETMTLKNICNSLSRRPQTLDVMLLFRTTKQVLQPLCAVLDAWKWDEDQGENQPVYDEFGSILLLVLAFKYRYDLSPSDMGISNNDSFLLKLMDRGTCSQKLSDLSEKQNKDLGAWVGALFIAEGISEETMSSCSPQEFYMLVTTLFDQSIGACESGKLDFDTLKGGFECKNIVARSLPAGYPANHKTDLLEPFLLPSLVVALTWLGNHIWESETDPTIPIKTLHSLVKPSSISGEAQAIHQTVLNITGCPLEEQLKNVRTRNQSRTDINPILDALEPYISFRRVGSCRRSELDTWTSHSAGGLIASIRATLQALVLWSANPGISMAPHAYTHRQLLAGIRMLGATRVLGAIIDEVKLQTEAGSGHIALDIATTMVCAPMTESFAVDQNNYHPVDTSKEALPRCAILTLRDALLLQHENVAKISESDPLRAEVVVRLARRVNILMAPPSQVSNVDVSNIIQNMHLGVEGQEDRMDLEPSAADVARNTVNEDDPDNINQMLDKAAADAVAAGMDGGIGVSQNLRLDSGAGMDAIDDVLNAADMAVGNPEFLDLDMEGMF
ncbi:Mediator of RNA polymerase II transcription subunit 5 [Penicillium digitatum PHI26]|uniref:Mediator of RNA polymerase II transcription subunit 5 n=3 Tax=Penicillium digitatum TaxID=36651 RepID=K9GY11_PEND2|nr:Mediator of RNA polymerase II transcription subunit 5 [Penicillium digitatum Pd1]EKV19538.1 Mediator of RNA polymerase II transcription subunit 5 [Penicillium digitatum PHI26]EKV20714.1 Mediator of RNA polymerase II transcription subunit 5 [Penicillium digitatum Pd1]